MSESELQLVKVTSLLENPLNPRKTYDDAALAELARSIASVGLLQPIVVRRAHGRRGKHEIVCGHRRVRAARLAGVEEVLAIVRVLSDAEVAWAALVENTQRQDVPPLEESAAVAAVKDAGAEIEEIVARTGRSTKWVRDRLKLLDLEPPFRAALSSGQLPLGGALVLATLPAERQHDLAKSGLKPQAATAETRPIPWSVTQVRDQVARTSTHLAEALWPLDDDTLPPRACTACPQRTSEQAELFGAEIARAEQCLVPACFRAKREAFLAEIERQGHRVHREYNAPPGWTDESWQPSGAGGKTWGELAPESVPRLYLCHEYSRAPLQRFVERDAVISALRAAGNDALAASLENQAGRKETPEERAAREEAMAHAAERYRAELRAIAGVMRRSLGVTVGREDLRVATAAALHAADIMSHRPDVWTLLGMSFNGGMAETQAGKSAALAEADEEDLRLYMSTALAVIVADAKHVGPQLWTDVRRLAGLHAPEPQPEEELLDDGTTKPGVCCDCGCTDGSPCINEETGEACSWADDSHTLCTHCDPNAPGLAHGDEDEP